MLLNKNTGEAVLRNGAGEEYRLIFTEDAIMAVETTMDVSIMDLLAKASTGRIKLAEVQALVWAGVNAHRDRSGASKGISPDKAMRIIKGCGGVVGVLPTLLDSIVACSALGLDVDDDDEERTGSGDDDPMDPTSAESDDTAPL